MGEVFLNKTGNPEDVKTDNSWPHKNFFKKVQSKDTINHVKIYTMGKNICNTKT